MKNISIKKITGAALISLGLVGPGCAKMSEFGSTNVNPNGISSPVTSALLTNSLSGLGGFAANLRRAVYAQYVSENQYTETSLYSLPQLDHSATYAGVLNDLQIIINYNSDPSTAGIASANGSNANQIATAKILKSYIMWTLTDAWGDLPYSQALLGPANLTPKFDKQEDIYFGIIKECKDAVAMFDGGAPTKGDILFGGDVLRWKKFANSIRMLMAIRLTNKYPAAGGKAAVEFADAANAGAGTQHIAVNADNAVLAYPGGAYQNPWYLVYQTRDDYASSKTMGDVLGGLGDSRISVFGTNTVMFPYGLTRDLAVQYGNSVGNGQSRLIALSFRQPNSPLTILGAAEVLLARAEGKERGWIPGGTAGAETDYNAAIMADYAEWGLTVPAGYFSGAANYNSGAGIPGSIGAGNAPYDNFRASSSNIQDAATPDKLSRIALQYWIAAFPNGNEGWASQRRTGVPNLKETRFKTGKFVNRYVYGAQTYSLNNANTLEAASRMGGDVQETKVWWDN